MTINCSKNVCLKKDIIFILVVVIMFIICVIYTITVVFAQNRKIKKWWKPDVLDIDDDDDVPSGKQEIKNLGPNIDTANIDIGEEDDVPRENLKSGSDDSEYNINLDNIQVLDDSDTDIEEDEP